MFDHPTSATIRAAAPMSRRMGGCRPALIFALVASGVGLGVSSRCHGANYVIHISVDGLRPDYMQAVINAGNAPNFKRFQDEGAWTNNARTDYTHSVTLPNHTSMITGRPVSQPAGMPNTVHHGYTWNTDPQYPTDTIHNFAGPGNPNVPYKASTFDVVHDAGLSTALYASKNKFVIYDQSYNATTGAANAYGRDKIDTYYGPESTLSMQNQLLADLAANHFKYTFVHYADTDDAGHSSGWGSAAYSTAVQTIDSYLGALFNLVTTDANLAGQTAIILSTDHGGTGFGHSDATLPVNYTIPFFVWGAGVAHGDLYSFNTDTRTNPGTLRPTYDAAGQPIRNGDGGNLALDLLGLGAIPGSLINAAQSLRVTGPGDFNANGVVDAADYVAWRNELGTTYSPGDYDFWRSHFGQVAGSGTGATAGLSSSVPEPATFMLLMLAAAMVPVLRRRPFLRVRSH